VVTGSTFSIITTASLGYCPVSSSVDSSRRYAWIAVQCGAGNDPVWAIDTDTYAVVAGPIGTGGIMSLAIVNPESGKLYVTSLSGDFVVDPSPSPSAALRSARCSGWTT
jgi:DNA-binding beta-propeller fold protein YncE